MASPSTKYRSQDWLNFREKVFNKKGKICEICQRDSSSAVIQCHHEYYDPEKEIWDYDIDDCITVVCKGCHAREHNILEPDDGWSLTKIIDLGDIEGRCERQTSNGNPCNEEIRYEYYIVHPKIPEERIVGSTCINHLTERSKVKIKEHQDSIQILTKIRKKLDDLNKPLTTQNFNRKPWKLIFNKYGEPELQYRLKRNIEDEPLNIISTIKKENNNFSANLSINSKWYKFKNKRNNKHYSRIYGDVKEIKKLLVLIQEHQMVKLKNREVIVEILKKEILSLLNTMNFTIVKQ